MAEMMLTTHLNYLKTLSMSNNQDLFEAEEQAEKQAIADANKEVASEYVPTEDAKQGSKAWFVSRLGKFNGSEYPSLLKKGRAKADLWGETAINIVRKVYIERDLSDAGQKMYVDEMFAKNFRQTQWGNNYEDEARVKYTEVSGNNVAETKSEVHPTIPYMRSSSDGRLTDLNGIIEIKCPYDVLKHAANCELDSVNEKFQYYGQIQGNIEIAGVDFCDFISYDPRRKSDAIKIISVERDQEYIDRIINRIVIAEKAVAYMSMGIDALGAILLSEKEYQEG